MLEPLRKAARSLEDILKQPMDEYRRDGAIQRFDYTLDLATWAKIEGDLEESSIAQKVDVIDYHRVSEEFQKVIDSGGIVL